MAGEHTLEKLKFTNNNYLCGATLRPDCLKTTNLCCLYCDSIEKCMANNKSKTKPCTADIIGLDEYCDLSI